MKRQLGLLVGLAVVVSFLLGLIASDSLPAGSASVALERTSTDVKPLTVSISPTEQPSMPSAAGNLDFAGVVERLNAAVGNIDAATRSGDDHTRGRVLLPRELSNDSSREGAGSGFIID